MVAKRKRYGAEEIIGKLREAEVGLAQGQLVGQVARNLGVSEQTYYRWRREYGGMKVDQAKRLKELERENAQLKRLVADQALDNSMLRESSPGETSEPGEAPPGQSPRYRTGSRSRNDERVSSSVRRARPNATCHASRRTSRPCGPASWRWRHGSGVTATAGWPHCSAERGGM